VTHNDHYQSVDFTVVTIQYANYNDEENNIEQRNNDRQSTPKQRSRHYTYSYSSNKGANSVIEQYRTVLYRRYYCEETEHDAVLPVYIG